MRRGERKNSLRNFQNRPPTQLLAPFIRNVCPCYADEDIEMPAHMSCPRIHTAGPRFDGVCAFERPLFGNKRRGPLCHTRFQQSERKSELRVIEAIHNGA